MQVRTPVRKLRSCMLFNQNQKNKNFKNERDPGAVWVCLSLAILLGRSCKEVYFWPAQQSGYVCLFTSSLSVRTLGLRLFEKHFKLRGVLPSPLKWTSTHTHLPPMTLYPPTVLNFPSKPKTSLKMFSICFLVFLQ